MRKFLPLLWCCACAGPVEERECSELEGVFEVNLEEKAGTCGEIDVLEWSFEETGLVVGACVLASGCDGCDCTAVGRCEESETLLEIQAHWQMADDGMVGEIAIQGYSYGSGNCASVYRLRGVR